MVDLGSSPGNVQITQTFGADGDAGALVNGQTYAIQFEAGAPFPGTAKLEVLWDGQVIGTIDPSGPGALTSYNYIVTANGTSDQLTFREIGTGNAPIPGDNQGHGFQTEGYHGTYLANVKLVATYVVDEDGLPAGNHDLPAPSQGDAPGLATSVTGLLGISWGADNYDSSTPDVDTDRFYQDNNGGVLTGRHVVFTDANIGVSGGKDSHSLTSHGDAVVLSLSSDGTVLVGTATDANNVTREVFEVSLSDDGQCVQIYAEGCARSRSERLGDRPQPDVQLYSGGFKTAIRPRGVLRSVLMTMFPSQRRGVARGDGRRGRAAFAGIVGFQSGRPPAG